MGFLNKIWAWFTGDPNLVEVLQDIEDSLRAEEALLEQRLATVKAKLVDFDQHRAYKLAEKMLAETRAARQKEMTEQEKFFLDTFITKRKDCKHLKGGDMRQLGPGGRAVWDKYAGPQGRAFKDYSVRDHTFLDGRREIKCTICSETWTPESPDWKEALRMSENSSNTRSSSEITTAAINTRNARRTLSESTK